MDSAALLFRQAHISVGFKTDNIGHACLEVFFDLFICEGSAFCKLTVDARRKLHSLLLTSDFGDFLLCKEARISLAFAYQLLGKALIYIASVTLGVVSVIPYIAFHGSAFVKVNAKESQRVDDDFYSAFNITLIVGVFDSEVELAP